MQHLSPPRSQAAKDSPPPRASFGLPIAWSLGYGGIGISCRLCIVSLVIIIGCVSLGLFKVGSALAWGISIDVGPVHINPISPVPITPRGTPDPVDAAAKAAQKKAEEAAKAAADAAKKAADALAAAAKANVEAEAALTKARVKVVTGGESLDEAAKGVLISKGKALETSAEAASAASEQTNNVNVAIGQAIAGDTGKTVLTLATGLDRFQVEFGTTAAIQAGPNRPRKRPKDADSSSVGRST